jgi:hypothetical protein
MPRLFNYPTKPLFLNDYIIGTDSALGQENVTRNFKVNEVVSAMLHAISIGTVTSISTASSVYITATAVPAAIISTGTITLGLSAPGLGGGFVQGSTEYNSYVKLQYLRGDNIWSLPGPTPTDVQVSSFGIPLTTDMSSINFTGNVTAAGGIPGYITVDFPGVTSLIDSIIAGAGITITDNAGVITINNAGVIQTRAGGNITLSGGTSNVTVSTVANPGTVTSISPGTGIATVVNSSSNAELDVEYTGNNNYIAGNSSAEVIDHNDTINYQQITSSNVKSTQLRDIPANILTTLNTYIDAADLNKIKNVEPTGFTTTAKAKYMVTCTLNEYNAIATKDVNTLYFIVGAGISYTQNLTLDITGITGSTNYSLTTLANGIAGTSVTGPAGTAFTFYITITGTNGATISSSNMPMTITGNIAVNGGTSNAVLTATVTNAATNSVRAALATITFGPTGNLNASGAKGTVWDYAPYVTPGFYNRPPDASGWPTYSVDPNFGYAPVTSSGHVYIFNPRLEILATSTYRWASGSANSSDPEYLQIGYGTASGAWSNVWLTGTVYSTQPQGQTNISTSIEATWENVPYQAVLAVVDQVTTIDSNGATVTAPSYTWNIQSLLPSSSFGTTITGLTNITGDPSNSYSWSSPATPGLPSNYAWTTNPTYTFNPAGTPTISGADGAVTLTIAGQITFTAPATNFTLTLKYQDTSGGDDTTGSIIIPPGGAVNVFPPDATTLNTQQGANYTIPSTGLISAVAKEGYAFTTSFTATPNPVTGTAPATGSAGFVYSVLTGEISLIEATPTVVQTVYTGNPSVTYNTVFSGGGSVSATNTAITSTGGGTFYASTPSDFAVGNGDCIFTVSKSSNSSVLVGDLTITWPDGTQSDCSSDLGLCEGATLSAKQKTINISNFLSNLLPQITIDEATPTLNLTSTLALVTTGISGTQFNNTGDPNGDTNLGLANSPQSFDPNIVANSGYTFSSGPFYTVNNITTTMPYSYNQGNVDETITITVTGTVVAASYRTTLNIILNVAGTEYTITGANTGSFNDTVAGVTNSFNITAPANTCYPTQGCNYHWISSNNKPVLSLTSGGTDITTNPLVEYVQLASNQTLNIYLYGTLSPDPVMSLNIINNIVGAPASPGATPQPLPDTAGLYTLSPGPVATVNTNPNPSLSSWQAPQGDPWNITLPGPTGSIIATPVTNFAFATSSPFVFTQSGTYALWGSPMPSFGTLHIAEYTLTGQVVRQYADIQLEQTSQVSTSRFKAKFEATGGATRSLVPNGSNCSALPCTITSSNYDAGLMTGNAGQVIITVEKTTNSGVTESSGDILYGDGTTKSFPNLYDTITDSSGYFTHTISSLGSLSSTALYSVSVDES